MSYQYKGVCYNTPESTLAAMAADMSGVGTDQNGNPTPFFTQVEGQSLKTISSTGAVVVSTPQLIGCQQIGIYQAASICIAIGVAWSIAWGYRTIGTALNSGGES